MTEWVPVPEAVALAEGAMAGVSVAGRKLLLFRTRAGYFVTERRCTHQAADLLRGYFSGDVIECPVHQGRFDVRTGCVLGAPASEPLRTFPVKIVDAQVFVELG